MNIHTPSKSTIPTSSTKSNPSWRSNNSNTLYSSKNYSQRKKIFIIYSAFSFFYLLLSLTSELLFMSLYSIYSFINILCIFNELAINSLKQSPSTWQLDIFPQKRLSVFLPFLASLTILFPTITGLFSLGGKFWLLFQGSSDFTPNSFQLLFLLLTGVGVLNLCYFYLQKIFPLSNGSSTFACLFIQSVTTMDQTTSSIQPLPTSSFLSNWWSKTLGLNLSALISSFIPSDLSLLGSGSSSRSLLPIHSSSHETPTSFSARLPEYLLVSSFIGLHIIIISFFGLVTPSATSQLFISTFLDITASLVMFFVLIWRIFPPFFTFGKVMMQSCNSSQIFMIEQDLEKIRLFHPQIVSYQDLAVWSLDTIRLVMSIRIIVNNNDEIVRSSILSSVHRVLGPRIFSITADIVAPKATAGVDGKPLSTNEHGMESVAVSEDSHPHTHHHDSGDHHHHHDSGDHHHHHSEQVIRSDNNNHESGQVGHVHDHGDHHHDHHHHSHH